MSALYAGAALAIVGGIVNAGGLCVQRRAAIVESRLLYVVSLACMLVGEVLNFGAYAFAPAVLIAPLSASSVVCGAFFAHLYLGEPLTRVNVGGAALVAASGVVLVAALPPSQDYDVLSLSALVDTPVAQAYGACLVIAMVYAIGVASKYGHTHAAVPLSVGALFAAASVVAIKAIAVTARNALDDARLVLSLPLGLSIGLLVLTIVMQLVSRNSPRFARRVTHLSLRFQRYLDLAMHAHSANIVIAVQYVFFTIASLASGALMYGEFSSIDTLGIILFYFGLLGAMLGVWLVSQR